MIIADEWPVYPESYLFVALVIIWTLIWLGWRGKK